MPLTHAPPPVALRAIHIKELDAATAEVAAGIRNYLEVLFDRLILPHTEWHVGIGQGVSGSRVTAALAPRPTSPDSPPLGVQAGSDMPTLGAISGKAVLLALNSADPDPQRALADVATARKFENWYDGLLLSATPYTAPLPPPVPKPAPPRPADLTEIDDDAQYHAYIQERATYTADVLEWTVDDVWRKRFAWVTRWWWGTVTAVNVGAKTATVTLDPMQGDQTSNTQVCGFGSRAWTASQLQGKYVRVGIDRAVGWWIDDYA